MINNENVYWAFSAAAQSVAAFIGLLFAGYALVLSTMEIKIQLDDTLTEIYEKVKKDYHHFITYLSIMAAASIITCLSVLYFNIYNRWWNILLEIIAASFTIISIVGGVLFVINIIDPKKYENKARVLSKELKPKSDVSKSPCAIFVNEYIELNQMIVKLWEERTGQIRISQRQGPPSFKEMVEILSLAEILPFSVYEDLIWVYGCRNLVFSGYVEWLDKFIIERTGKIKEKVHRLTTG